MLFIVGQICDRRSGVRLEFLFIIFVTECGGPHFYTYIKTGRRIFALPPKTDALKIIFAALSVIKLSFTIKIRVGFEQLEETRKQRMKLLKILEDSVCLRCKVIWASPGGEMKVYFVKSSAQVSHMTEWLMFFYKLNLSGRYWLSVR